MHPPHPERPRDAPHARNPRTPMLSPGDVDRGAYIPFLTISLTRRHCCLQTLPTRWTRIPTLILMSMLTRHLLGEILPRR
jgi:hypothetical protein